MEGQCYQIKTLREGYDLWNRIMDKDENNKLYLVLLRKLISQRNNEVIRNVEILFKDDEMSWTRQKTVSIVLKINLNEF